MGRTSALLAAHLTGTCATVGVPLSRTASACLIGLLAALAGCGGTQHSTEDEDAELITLADSNHRFALDLYRRLVAEHEGNLFFSPYSVSSALAMTLAGARGETATEMREALHLKMPDEELPGAFKELSADLRPAADADYQLLIANALFAQKAGGFLEGPGRGPQLMKWK